MPLELLERDPILATVMPGHGGQPGDPGGDEAEPDDDTETEDEESEGDPS